MARFMCGCQGQRGGATRLGGTSSGATAFCRGWRAGVKVEATEDTVDGEKDVDCFYVYVTGGSNAATSTFCIGRVVATTDGPVFHPSEVIKKLVLEGTRCDT